MHRALNAEHSPHCPLWGLRGDTARCHRGEVMLFWKGRWEVSKGEWGKVGNSRQEWETPWLKIQT